MIRTATDADVVALQSFATALLAEQLPGIFRREPPTLADEVEFVRSRTEPANSTLLLAEMAGEIVGVLDFVGGTLAEEAHAGLVGVSVVAGARGHGIGTRLIAALLAWAPTAGIRRVELRAFSSNARAIALYKRLGFEIEGRLREALLVDGEPVDMIVLAQLPSTR